LRPPNADDQRNQLSPSTAKALVLSFAYARGFYVPPPLSGVLPVQLVTFFLLKILWKHSNTLKILNAILRGLASLMLSEENGLNLEVSGLIRLTWTPPHKPLEVVWT
jgi:hypothetical protein